VRVLDPYRHGRDPLILWLTRRKGLADGPNRSDP
jgi:hypothetical protein